MLDNTQKRILSFFTRNPSIAIHWINSNYPFSRGLFDVHGGVLNWQLISENPNFVNDLEFIERYTDKLDWSRLSEYISNSLFDEFTSRFYDKVIWSANSLPETAAPFSLCFNMNLHWTLERIEKHEHNIDWDELSQNSNCFWSEQIIEKYSGMINWELFNSCHYVPYSEDFIDKFIGKIDHPYSQLGIPDDLGLVRKYMDDVSWRAVSYSEKIPWTVDLIREWSDRLHLNTIITNRKAIDSIDKFNLLFSNFNDEKYEWLSFNRGTMWTWELLEKHKDKWDWDMISINPSLPWSIELIEYFKDYLVFGKLTPCATEPDSYDIKTGMEMNPGIQWSIDLLEKYEGEWELGLMDDNPTVWEKAFKAHVNDEVVNLFLRISC